MDEDCARVVAGLKRRADPANVAGMARFGINPEGTLGVSVAELRRLARGLRGDHRLALALWSTGIHEARILATIIDDPKQASEAQMEAWVADFDSWDVCDQCCLNLFRRTPFAHAKARAWTGRDETFVKRAGFTLIATIAVHDEKADDSVFVDYLALVSRHADDERNFVKKAVNWALRQIGKCNAALNAAAVALAGELGERDNRAARWVGRDALRELSGDKVRSRLGIDNTNGP